MPVGRLEKPNIGGLAVENVLFDRVRRNSMQNDPRTPLGLGSGGGAMGGGAAVRPPARNFTVERFSNTTAKVTERTQANNKVDFLLRSPTGSKGRLEATIEFSSPKLSSAAATGAKPKFVKSGSTKDAIRTFTDVFNSVDNFVRVAKPQSIKFSGANPSLQRIYERFLPDMAKRLGGTPKKQGDTLMIEFP